MKMYEKGLLIDILETKILEIYNEYYPQGQYNGIFVNYLYKYIRDNTYCGKHSDLLYELNQLKQYSDTLSIKENSDLHTYVLTDVNQFSDEILTELSKILKTYYNYKFLLKSPNRIVIDVHFGWLPPNAGSWLNLLNDDNLIDYYIDGITLVPNTHTTFNGKPNSGYVCYKIDNINEYDTVMFLIKNKINFSDDSKIKVASLMTELEGSKGATLNRIVETTPISFFYEIGHYNRNYISSEKASLIIQVPYEYAISEYYYLFNVNNSVIINNKNDDFDTNATINFFINIDDFYVKMDQIAETAFYGRLPYVEPDSVDIKFNIKDATNNISISITDDGKGHLIKDNSIIGSITYEDAEFYIDTTKILPNNYEIEYPIVCNYQSNAYFIKNEINIKTVINLINSNINIFDDTLIQYLLGDFIWKTADSKLIAYAQNLINALFNTNIIPDGMWSDELSKHIKTFKHNNNVQSIFDDDVIDKYTEKLMTTEYKRITFNSGDPNSLFNEW